MRNTELYRRQTPESSAVHAARLDLTRLGGSEIQVWEGTGVFGICRSLFLRSRLENWIKASRTAGAPPLLKDLYGFEEEAHLDDAMLLLQQDDDFIYVHQGPRSVLEYGKVFRGALLSSIPGNMSLSFRHHYNAAAADMRPRYLQFRTDFSARHVRWERIVLPLVSDEKQASKFLLLYSEPLDDKLEILQAAFDRSAIGMVAAAKTIGEEKTLEDAVILLANSRARSMLGMDDNALPVSTVRDLRAWVQAVRKWEQIGEPKTTLGKTIIGFRDKEKSKNITVVIEPIDHYVVFHFLD
ncbi:hypothetical protein ANOBCDAF_04250 [Pleomorphomonas sp. T1.2MG-36]|uniref:hypothetical protein n=1 Tax=Pleomorphomonas sp. T1.2MG-36 TaxID=3041167 RepID=UPI0024776FA8|nr:hypothetical protein [Pleomorphomonas sp. T1.2MG-36]CAI9418434.1 hypothetical protein ANOBCDAF_04250 [Pleomorphomonas sp. T1.2MG-36]